MSGMEILFITYFGIMAACLTHQFVICQDAAGEFVSKVTGGIVGALLVWVLLGHRSASVESLWYTPLVGAFVGSLLVAAAWKLSAGHEIMPSHAKVKPVL
jgi:uncharacterized membrane protein YeaQ/YmgE (transglycosylase-associated protein family)